MKKSYLQRMIIAAVYTSALLITITSHAQIISTYAGNGTGALTGDGGAATAASLRFPYNINLDGSGNMYVADWGNNAIRKISPSGTITRIAGNGVPTFGGDGGPATAALLCQPADIAFDGSGNLYFTDNCNRRIRKIDGAGVITTVVGTGTAGYSGDGGPATAATMNDPRGLTFDAAGNLYFADAGSRVIRKVNTSGVISTVAGNGTAGAMGDGGPATAAQLNNPRDVVFDAAGVMYIADNNNHRIRQVNSSGIISVFAGVGTPGFSGDGGPATAANISYPEGIYIDAHGNMFIGEGAGNRVRKIKTSGIISTVAGTGTYGYSGDGGPATAADMKTPIGTIKDASGNLYICDEGNHRIRKVTPTPITITGGAAVCVGQTTTLTASETGGTWTSAIPGTATVGSSSGIVTAVASGTVVISYTESGITGTRTVTVNPLPGAITGTLSVCVGAVTTLSSSSGGGIWSSSSTATASVDAMGNVTGVAAGAATITFGVLPSMCYVTAVVTVNPCTLAMEDANNMEHEVKLYPNPNTGSCTIDLPQNTTLVIVTDYLGRVVTTENVSTQQAHTLTLSMESLPAGNYLVKVHTTSGIYRNKLVIVK